MTGRHKEAEEVLLPHLAAARERGQRSRIGRGELVGTAQQLEEPDR